jgi:hypothetical protein
VPVQTHVLPLWQIPLYGIVGGVFLCPEPLDKVLGVFNSGEADKLAPQAQAPLLAMNAAAPLLSAVDGVAPVELVEERVQSVLVTGDRVGLVQGQPRPLDGFSGLRDR